MKKITLLIATMFAGFMLMAQTVSLTVTVDMQPAITNVDYGFKQASTTVVLAGNFSDPEWIRPGDAGTVYMTKGDNEMWTASVDIPSTAEGTNVEFKIFILNDDKTPSWDYGDKYSSNRSRMVYEADVAAKIQWGNEVGIDITPQPKVNVYPNPFSNSLTIESSSTVKEIRISNILGQQVMHFSKLESKMVISTAQLQNGVYVVSIIDNNNVVTTKRIIKQ